MLDTNICIYIINKHPLEIRARFEQLQHELICISMITCQELYFGAFKSTKRQETEDKISQFSKKINVLSFDHHAAVHSADIDAYLQEKGKRIGPYDTQIAGHARSNDMVLVTNNEREFARIPNLNIENWISG